jgi:hypothetical protein
MKLRFSNKRNHALTLVEVLVVIVVLVVLVAMILPMLARSKGGPGGYSCVNNLKQIGLAYLLWAGDNNDKYPMEVSAASGGTMGLTNGSSAWFNFLIMSNQISWPKILHCPFDTNGFAATNFSVGFNNRNVSYFVSLDASKKLPQVLLSGDDNFEIGGISVKSGLTELSCDSDIAWTSSRHFIDDSHFWTPIRRRFFGNILIGDGSVQQLGNSGLTNLLHQTGLATNRLAIP